MFRKTLMKVAATWFAGILLPASVHATSFVGGGVITQYTHACAPDNSSITSRYTSFTMDYLPSELNGRTSAISLVFTDGVARFSRRGRFNPSSRFVNVTGQAVFDGNISDYGVSPRIRVVRRSVTYPRGASLANAQALYLELIIRNYWGIQGCSVRVEATVGQSATALTNAATEPATETAPMVTGHPGMSD